MALFSDGLSYPCPRIPGVISHFLGCFCRAWDDDDLGVYQGAYSVAPLPITLSPPPPLPQRSVCVLICGPHIFGSIGVRLYSPLQAMPPK